MKIPIVAPLLFFMSTCIRTCVANDHCEGDDVVPCERRNGAEGYTVCRLRNIDGSGPVPVTLCLAMNWGKASDKCGPCDEDEDEDDMDVEDAEDRMYRWIDDCNWESCGWGGNKVILYDYSWWDYRDTVMCVRPNRARNLLQSDNHRYACHFRNRDWDEYWEDWGWWGW